MQGLIRRFRTRIAGGLLLTVAGLLVSCATHKDTALVNDPEAKQESLIPWNKQEKWETGGQLSGVTDRR
jgi:hypothetical protein